MKNQTALDWYWDKIKSHFEHDGDLLETASFTFAIAKQKQKQEHAKTWDAALDSCNKRGNDLRAWEDFDEYYENLN